MKKNDFLKNIFSEIKKDNLENFKKYLTDSKTIYFKNKQKENFLFYALQTGSVKISKYLVEEYPEFLLERNAYLLTPFSDIIYKNNEKGFNAFLQLSKISNISFNEVYDKGGNIYSVPLLAIEKLTKNNWFIFEDLTKKFWNEKNLGAKDSLGYNIAHKIAINNADYAISLLEFLPKSLFQELDSEVGASPFLISLKFSKLNLIKEFFKKSDIYQETIMGSNAIHLSIFNEDIEVLKFILDTLKDRPDLITKSNLYDDSPLNSAINHHNIDALTLLVPYYIEQNKDLTDEIIHFIKKNPKDFDNFKVFLNNVKPENLKKLIANEECLGLFFSYIFHYSVENDIENFKNKFFWKEIHKIQSKFLNHQIYSSTILGKRSVNYKINYLLNNKDFLKSSESNEFFQSNKETDLYFINSDYKTFNKETKISSFISLLNTMPASQINDLIKKTNFINKTDELDKLHLFCIGLKKHSIPLLNSIEMPTDKLVLNDNLNCALMMQDLLTDYDFNPNLQDFFNLFISQIGFTPIRLFHNYIDKIFLSESEEQMNKIHNVLSLFKDFPDYKKEFIHLLIYRLTQTEDNQPDLLSLFIKNDKAVLSAIENINHKHLNKIKNNEFTKHILSIYGERKNLIDLLIDIAQSKNIYKHELMQLVLPKCILNNSVSKKLSKQIKEKPIDDYGWAFLIKNFIHNKSFSFLLDTFFSSKQKFSDFSTDVLDMIDSISDSNQEHLYSCFNNFELKEKELIILDSLNSKCKLNYEKIISNSLENYNFKPILYLSEYKNIDINNIPIPLHSFWKKLKIKNFYIDLQNQNKLNSEPINNYFNFLQCSKENLSIDTIKSIFDEFVIWLKNNDNEQNNIAIIRTINIFFKIFSEEIHLLKEESLINICEVILSNNNLNNLNSAKQEYEEALNLIFSNKDYNIKFFKEINNQEFFKNNKHKFPEEQQKRLQFYSLQDKLISNTVNSIKPLKI